MTTDILVTKRRGTTEPYDGAKISRAIRWAAHGLNLSPSGIVALENLPLYPGITTDTIQRNAIVAAADRISQQEPDWTRMAARLLLQTVYKQANGGSITYPTLQNYWDRGIAAQRLDATIPDLYDMTALNCSIVTERDRDLEYLGLQTLADRYFVRDQADVVIELPQHFWMRVAMGIARDEPTREQRTTTAIRYYNTYSTMRASSSTPTLFNSGTTYPQLSSCFGHTVYDNTDSIMDNMSETAKYSKHAGGDSISITAVRSKGSRIRSTGGRAGGPIPYLKLYNDVLIGFDQSGKRKGSGAAYMEPWHANIYEFLELRENGDERERAHDIFPALWIPDLFMRRVRDGGAWSLFNPNDVPDLPELHDSIENTGLFTQAYERYEAQGLAVRVVDAYALWTQILTRLYQHGVYWPCFKDVSNARYMQQRPIHHSNLCFSGDTKVAVADGRNAVDMKTLCDQGMVFDVYSAVASKISTRGRRGGGRVQGSQWKTVIRQARAVYTGRRSMVRVHLDNGDTFDCTPDHKLALTKYGRWIEAQDSLGLRLEPWFSTKIENKYRAISGSTGGNSYQHRIIWEYANGPLAKGKQIDHLEDRPYDGLDNLQSISKKKHLAKTSRNMTGTNNPIHQVDKSHHSSIAAKGTFMERNPRFSGFSDQDLIRLGKCYAQSCTTFTRRGLFEYFASLGAPKSLNKNRFQRFDSAGYTSNFDYLKALIFREAEYFDPIDYTDATSYKYTNSSELPNVWRENVDGDLIWKGRKVTSITKLPVQKCYDVQILDNCDDNEHNFYIITGQDDTQALTSSGVLVHNCTEILLRDDHDTSFVCNLGSINVAHQDHLLRYDCNDAKRLKFQWNECLESTVRSWVRNLDSVITVGVTPHAKGRRFQLEDRAIGLGAMGEALAIQLVGILYESREHVQYCYELWRQISLTAIHESARLARERGTYPTFDASLWARGQLPSDNVQHTRVIYGFDLVIDNNAPFATEAELRELVRGGMRNSALMAIAPTATIANIIGVPQSHELPWDIDYVKENLSGTFKIIAPTVIHNPHGLPTPTAREVDQKWSIWCAAARQIHIDQSQSLNMYVDPNLNFEQLGELLDENYFEAWDCGVKTNYYLYSRASENEKQTLNKPATVEDTNTDSGPACYLRPGDAGFEDCEACQ